MSCAQGERPPLQSSVSPAPGRCPWLSLFGASLGGFPSTVPLQATCHFPPDAELPRWGEGEPAQVSKPQRGAGGCWRRRYRVGRPRRCLFSPSYQVKRKRDGEVLPGTQAIPGLPPRWLRARGPATHPAIRASTLSPAEQTEATHSPMGLWQGLRERVHAKGEASCGLVRQHDF